MESARIFAQEDRIRAARDVSQRRSPVGRTLFLHVGTHKTGTTSLQKTLSENSVTFATAGLYFPRTGRAPGSGGHHNIAWELARDARFDPTFGTLSELVAEIAAVDSPSVCLSSEDFEYLYHDARSLERLRDAFAATNFRIAVVIYLRPQASYAESLYAELVKHGFPQTFGEFLQKLLIDGKIEFGSYWRFTFDYEVLVGNFAAIFGEANVIVRPYSTDRPGVSVTDDFLTLVGIDPHTIGGRTATGRLNSSAPFIDVVRRYKRNTATGDGDVDGDIVADWAYRGRFDPVRLPEVERIAERFSAGNARIAARYGVAIPFVSRRDLLGDIAAALGFDPASEARRRLLRAQGTRRAALGTPSPAHGHDHPAGALGRT